MSDWKKRNEDWRDEDELEEEEECECPWVDSKGKVRETAYCQYLLEKHPMMCLKQKLFDQNGEVDEDALLYEVHSDLRDFVLDNLAKKEKQVLDALRIETYTPEWNILCGLAESAVKQYQTRIEHSRPEERAVTIFIAAYFFKDRSVSAITVCTCAIVHSPPKEAAIALRAYIAFKEYMSLTAKRWIPVVISRLAKRKVQIGVRNRESRISIPERIEKIIM